MYLPRKSGKVQEEMMNVTKPGYKKRLHSIVSSVLMSSCFFNPNYNVRTTVVLQLFWFRKLHCDSLLLKKFVQPLLITVELNNLSMKSNISRSSESTHDSNQSKNNQFNDIERKVTSKARLEQSSYRHLCEFSASGEECQEQTKC
jgi:hypothetical protein